MGKKSRLKKGRDLKPPAPASDRQRCPLWLLLLPAAAAFLAFAATIPYDFVYDDEYQILRNPWIRDWSKVAQFFTTDVWAFARGEGTTSYYRPFHMVVNALGYSLSGLKPHGYHLLSILLHCGCSMLVAFAGSRLTRDRLLGAAAGLIFALHPVHAESVAWIAGLVDPLCAVFYFGALCAWLADDREPGRPWLPAALFFGALLSKEMAVTFPLVAAWLDWCRFRRLRWKRLAALALPFAAYLILRISALHGFAAQSAREGLDAYSWVLTAVVFLARYVAMMFIPWGINPYHVFEPVIGILDYRFIAGVCGLALLAAAAWRMRKDGTVLFLLGFCVLTLLPLLNIGGLGDNAFADRYLYIPTLGSCILLPCLARRGWERLPDLAGMRGAAAGALALTLLLAVFAWLLAVTTPMWRDAETLYSGMLERSPKAVFVMNNLASHYFNNGEYDKAESLYLRAQGVLSRSSRPNRFRLAQVHSGLGGVLYQRGKFEQARASFEKAREIRPLDPTILQNLGSVHVALQDYRTAVKYYGEALEINPRNEVTYNNLAAIYLTAEDYDQAIAHAQKALEIFPRYGDAYMNLGRAHAAKGMREEARRAYLAAREADPSKSEAVERELKGLR